MSVLFESSVQSGDHLVDIFFCEYHRRLDFNDVVVRSIDADQNVFFPQSEVKKVISNILTVSVSHGGKFSILLLDLKQIPKSSSNVLVLKY